MHLSSACSVLPHAFNVPPLLYYDDHCRCLSSISVACSIFCCIFRGFGRCNSLRSLCLILSKENKRRLTTMNNSLSVDNILRHYTDILEQCSRHIILPRLSIFKDTRELQKIHRDPRLYFTRLFMNIPQWIDTMLLPISKPRSSRFSSVLCSLPIPRNGGCSHYYQCHPCRPSLVPFRPQSPMMDGKQRCKIGGKEVIWGIFERGDRFWSGLLEKACDFFT